MTRRACRDASPVVGDPLIGDGTKYRIRIINPHCVHLAAAGPSWRRGPIVALAEPGRLAWDAVAGVWRAPIVLVAS